MIIHDTQDKIYSECIEQQPGVIDALTKVRHAVPGYKREIWQFQAAALYCLAAQFNTQGARLLEIGTAWGYSAAVIAEACPLANLVTLNPHHEEAIAARKHLRPWPNVKVLEHKSTEFFTLWQGDRPRHEYELPSKHEGYLFDMIWVDGDHKRVALDFPFWNHLRAGGLFLFHDFSPSWSSRPCAPVYDGLMRFREWLGRDMDVLVCDDSDTGIAGWYRQPEDGIYKDSLVGLAG